MPIDRDFLLAPKTSDSLTDGLMEQLHKAIREIQQPQSKMVWIALIKTITHNSDYTCLSIFRDLVINGILVFTHVYQGEPIYVGPSTPVVLHDKTPVIELES